LSAIILTAQAHLEILGTTFSGSDPTLAALYRVRTRRACSGESWLLPWRQLDEPSFGQLVQQQPGPTCL
jgi:hypothetical protein